MYIITEEEQWKSVESEGYEHYEVSNQGRVRNTKRENTLLKLDSKNGYSCVKLSNKGRRKGFYVHRLVAIAFIPKVLSKDFINHINGIKKDNRVLNLEWCTFAENNRHAIKTGLNKPGGKKTSKNRSPDLLNEVYIRLKAGDSLTKIAKEHKLDVSDLSKYLKDHYGREHIEDLYNSEVQGKIPESKIEEFYHLITQGKTIQDIAKLYKVDEDIRNRIYRSFGKEHVTDILRKNVSLKREKVKRDSLSEQREEISSYYKRLKEGKNFSEIGQEFNCSHKTIRKKLNLQYGEEHIDSLRFK